MNEKVVKMLKEYRLTIFAIVVFGIIISIGVKGAAKQQRLSESKIEIPLPLQNASEQILYRKGYTVSYNKENKIPNWVQTTKTVDGQEAICALQEITNGIAMLCTTHSFSLIVAPKMPISIAETGTK